MQVMAHGVDIVEIRRIQAMLQQHGDRFVQRCFTAAERSYADAANKRRAERYAVRFACKEAVLKALGTGWRSGITWRDIQTLRDPSGQPRIELSGRCAVLAREMRITRWIVSFSHIDSVAIASVIGWG